MKEINLNERLLTYLRSENCIKEINAASLLESILDLDAEAVNLRLNNVIPFTTKEMGIVIRELNIPIDFLFVNDPPVKDFSFDMFRPPSIVEFDDLINLINGNVSHIQEMNNGSLVVGQVSDSLPLEFYGPYPKLTKFMYHKWNYYFVKDKTGFPTFAQWEIPDKLKNTHINLVDAFGKFKSAYYIWDNSIIWNLVNEITHMHNTYLLTLSDVLDIKKEILALLHTMETVAKGKEVPHFKVPESFRLYIYGISIGVYCSYMYNEKDYAVCYRNQFVESPWHSEMNHFQKVYTWVNSLKKSSVLITGANERERIGFFQQQRRIVNQI